MNTGSPRKITTFRPKPPAVIIERIDHRFWTEYLSPGDFIQLTHTPKRSPAALHGRVLSGRITGDTVTISKAHFTLYSPEDFDLPPRACPCKAYPYLHLKHDPLCFCTQPAPYCGSCGQGTTPILVDTGIGAYEYWGMKGNHIQEDILSSCCEAPLYADLTLTTPYHPPGEDAGSEEFDPEFTPRLPIRRI